MPRPNGPGREPRESTGFPDTLRHRAWLPLVRRYRRDDAALAALRGPPRTAGAPHRWYRRRRRPGPSWPRPARSFDLRWVGAGSPNPVIARDLLSMTDLASPARPRTRSVFAVPDRLAWMTLVAFAITALGLFAAPRTTVAWSANTFSSASESQAREPDEPVSSVAGLKALKVDSTLSVDRPQPEQGHDRAQLLQPQRSRATVTTSSSVMDKKGYCYKIAGENIGWNNVPRRSWRRPRSRASS